METSTQCRGCFKAFDSSSKLWRHLRESKKAKCKKEYRRLLAERYYPGITEVTHHEPAFNLDSSDSNSNESTSGSESRSQNSEDNLHNVENIPLDPDPLDIEAAENDTEGEVLPELLSDDEDSDEEDESQYTDSDFESEEDDSETEETNIIYDDPHLWEPQTPAPKPTTFIPSPSKTSPIPSINLSIGRQNIETKLHQPIAVNKFTDCYPRSGAGAPVSDTIGQDSFSTYKSQISDSHNNPYAPFADKMNWDIARWAKLRGPGSNALDELLKIEGLQEGLGLSYKNSRELNKIIDISLPGCPQFRCKQIVMGQEVLELYYRPVMDCIRSLFADPNFVQHLIFEPEQHFTDENKTIHLYHDMHTGKWWWNTQKEVEKNGNKNVTIIPIIISTDKTQLTHFKGKTCYPVYLTIGNIPKEICCKPSRQGQILLAYLPVTKFEQEPNQAKRCRMQANLFHSCLHFLLSPTIEAGTNGTIMHSGDGISWRCHPIFAVHVGDYPEQCLACCVKNKKCPSCQVEFEALGDWVKEWISDPPLYDLEKILEIMDDPDHPDWPKLCEEAGVKPVYKPYWQDLPYADPFLSIAPDILHQLYQGIFKHLVEWLRKVYGDAEIDARFRRMPPNHQTHFFSKGISTLSNVTGREHADMGRVILGVIIELPLKGTAQIAPPEVVREVRALLDFMYLAQYPVHSDETLTQMVDALEQFHKNKDIFIDLGARFDFLINKLHYALHYRLMIERLGTTDNYNTEHTEQLHIPFAKTAYSFTNSKNEYSQMTLWVERKEKVLGHEKFISWVMQGKPSLISLTPAEIPKPFTMTKHPSKKQVFFDNLIQDYHASEFVHALTHFIYQRRNPSYTYAEVEGEITKITLPFTAVAVYHKARFWLGSQEVHRLQSNEHDVVHASPARTDDNNKEIAPARFDTVLVSDGKSGYLGVQGYRVAQVEVIFSLSKASISASFPPSIQVPQYLAYVEWFTLFPKAPEDDHLLYYI
ncbi:hypothetical protein QCA50_007343 [Cerrena zonata]|uniref:C2H2-type domain-containing protein n=1 Tax=Cerrena zonata TaxID=2478898 RepID=A0AAW0GJA2_9APHY